jgi:biotin operon repressor
MEKAKRQIKDIMLTVSEAHMMGEELSGYSLQKIYQTLKDIENDIKTFELNVAVKLDQKIIDIPKLPRGDHYNPFPRMVYLTVCELYSQEKYFSVYDLMDLTGASRTQIKADLDRLRDDGYIELLNKREKERVNYYKYKPTKM